MLPTIVACGGGGIGGGPEDALLDDYLLSLTARELPRVCFIGTASGDAERYAVAFFNAFSGERCRPTQLNLFFRTVEDIRSMLLAQDLIYVGGGNTAAMLAIWRQHGVDSVLREAWEQGIVLCGSSAGANCWFEACSTDSFGRNLSALRDGLGFLQGSFCPHYDGEVNRRPTLERFINSGELPSGYAVDNYTAIRFTGTELSEVVSASPTARAYRVQKNEAGQFQQQELVPRVLE